MKWKDTIITLGLALFLTTIFIVCFKKEFPINDGIIVLSMAIYTMFGVIVKSSIGIIKKHNFKFNLWGITEGICGLILMTLLFIATTNNSSIIDKKIHTTLTIIFLILFFITSAVGIRMEMNMKKR